MISNQTIFERLASIECELFYKWTDMSPEDPHYEEIKQAHAEAKKALEIFAKATGCHN